MKVFRGLMLLLAIVGIAFMAYPTIATFVANYTSTQVIIDYEKQIERMEEIELQRQKEKAKEYNKKLTELDFTGLINWNKNENVSSESAKNTNKEKKKTTLRDKKKVYKKGELLGYIVIEKIDVHLPLYEGTHDSVLQKGIGHLEGSSLPVGGKNTHSIFTGHSGLAKATLFSRLQELEKEDVFIIHFLDEILAYKVDNIEIVEPDKADKYITIERNKDYVTLITCTPITVNTHRLLVRGHRIPYDGKNSKQSVVEKIKQQRNNMMFNIVIVLVVFLLILVIITTINRKKDKKR